MGWILVCHLAHTDKTTLLSNSVLHNLHLFLGCPEESRLSGDCSTSAMRLDLENRGSKLTHEHQAEPSPVLGLDLYVLMAKEAAPGGVEQ